MEGILAWNDEKLMLRHIVRGEYCYEPIAVGQELEVFQNGNWRKVQIKAIDQEPFIENWNYGSGIGCEARFIDS